MPTEAYDQAMRALIVRFSGSPWLKLPWLVSAAVVAVVLTFFATFRIDTNGSPAISFRHHELWRSTLALRIILPGDRARADALSLAQFYARFASGDSVLRRSLRSGPLKGRFEIETTLLHGSNPAGLNIRGFARSGADASSIAGRISRGFRGFLMQQQDRAQIPAAQRARLEVVSSSKTERVKGRRLLGPLSALALVWGLLALAAASRLRAS